MIGAAVEVFEEAGDEAVGAGASVGRSSERGATVPRSGSAMTSSTMGCSAVWARAGRAWGRLSEAIWRP